MKLSNFTVVEMKGKNALDKTFRAEVDVETGFIWWKKIVKREIFRKYGNHWHFVDTGEYTPNDQAEALERSYKAVTGTEF